MINQLPDFLIGEFFVKNPKKSGKIDKNSLQSLVLYAKIERLKIHTRAVRVIRARKIFQCGRCYEPTYGEEVKRRFELWQLSL